MIITCSQCQAKFKLAPEQIKETGSKVRCSNCHYVFTVFRPSYVDDQVMDLPPQAPGEDGADFDDYDDPPAPAFERQPTDPASIKARRDRRRQFYSDLKAGDEADYEDDEDLADIYDDDDLLDESGRPPLRRASARAEKAAARPDDSDSYNDDYDDDQGYDEDYDDGEYDDEEFDPEAEGAYDQYDTPDESGRGDSLGLSADPVEEASAYIDDDDHRLPSDDYDDAPSIRAAVTRTQSGRPPLPLIIALVVVAVIMVAGIIFFANRSAPTALSTGLPTENGPAVDNQPETPAASGPDASGTEYITFSENKQNHYVRENREAGRILIITGMVRNSYPEPRSFIRLRGHLLSADGANLADRFVYAGNIVSEDDLRNLPMSEIVSRLSFRGGQDGKNMNVAPGQEIPFMFVFDRLPENVAEYRIDPDSSTPAAQ